MKPLPKSIQQWADANPDKFDEGWTEQDSFLFDGSWSYWIYLQPGWINGPREVHVVHEDTTRECLYQLKHDVVPCSCEDCRAAVTQERDALRDALREVQGKISALHHADSDDAEMHILSDIEQIVGHALHFATEPRNTP